MNVKKIMTADVATCGAGDSLSCAAQIMWERDCGIVPVVDADQTVIGTVTDRDICMGAYTQGRPLEAIRVDSVMAANPICCRVNDKPSKAWDLMAKHRVRRLPVTDGKGKIAGILSLNDLLTNNGGRSRSKSPAFLESLSDTLGHICEHRPDGDIECADAKAAQPGKKRKTPVAK